MKKLYGALVLVCSLMVSLNGYGQANQSNTYNATTYGNWSSFITSGNASTGSSSIGANPSAFINGQPALPFAVGTSVTINKGQANTETVTPTTVANCYFNSLICVLGASFTNKHVAGEALQSGTYGLQEAINAAITAGSGTVIIDASWQGPSGTSLILAAKGSVNVMIQDNRNPSGAVFYQWNGTAYVQSGGGSGSSYDTRPFATASAVGVTVAASGSCAFGISPSAVPAQQTVATCNTGTAGGPGTITYVHLTLGPSGDNTNILENSTINFNCDGASQSVPMSLFFLTKDNPIPFSTDWNAYSLGHTTTFSGNYKSEINYSTGCTVSFTNASNSSSTILFGEVTYRVGSSVSRPSRAHWYAYTIPLTAYAPYANVQMLPTIADSNGGELESIKLYGSSGSAGGWEEGYTSVVVDGNVAVTANGTEDFFGSGYNGVNSVGGHYSPKWGQFYASSWGTPASLQSASQSWDSLLYRNFQVNDADNVLFSRYLSAFQPNGENGKPGAGNPGTVNYSSLVTFWTHDPMLPAPTFSPNGGVASGTTVTISDSTAGATLCSSTSATPSGNGGGTCVTGTSGSTVTVTGPVTLRAIATKNGNADSFPASVFFAGPYSAPTYRQNCSNSSGPSAVTSIACTITPTAGDFIYAYCSSGAVNSFTATSSQSTAFTAMTGYSSNNGSSQGNYAFSAPAGSTTFTCNGASSGYFGITVLDYAPGSLSNLNASAANFVTSNSTYTSPAISVSGSAFYIVCGHADYGPPTPTAGTINGTAANGRTMTTSFPSNCQDLSIAGSTTNAVGTILGSTAGNWDGTIAAFD